MHTSMRMSILHSPLCAIICLNASMYTYVFECLIVSLGRYTFTYVYAFLCISEFFVCISAYFFVWEHVSLTLCHTMFQNSISVLIYEHIYMYVCLQTFFLLLLKSTGSKCKRHFFTYSRALNWYTWVTSPGTSPAAAKVSQPVCSGCSFTCIFSRCSFNDFWMFW